MTIVPKLPSALDICRSEMLASEDELLQRYPPQLVARVMRVRDLVNYWMAQPDISDRDLKAYAMSKFHIAQSSAYEDISIVHSLAPLLTNKPKEFHRARYNEMILETYRMAKARKDAKTMERAASSYAKFNDIIEKDDYRPPYDEIVPQHFDATSDPSVIGIKPIPNIRKVMDALIKELSSDFFDIEDVSFEETDIHESKLFPPSEQPT